MNKLSVTLLLGVLLLFCLYLPLDVSRSSLHSFKTVIDDFIPLLTFFMTIYISYGIFLVFSLFYFIRNAHTQFLNITLLGIIIACLCAYVVYLVFQNSVERPAIIASNLFDKLYMSDNNWIAPYNAF